MAVKKNIPNLITLLNLFCGCCAIVFSIDDLLLSTYFIGIAVILDFLDGFMARVLKVETAIGRELDSLADVVSFGVAPGFILFFLIQMSMDQLYVTGSWTNYIPFIAFLIPVFSALRLAKFNTDQRQREYFIGLPTPANAILIASIPLLMDQTKTLTGTDPYFVSVLFRNAYLLISITILLSYLLIAELPLLSLKFKTFNWMDNKIRYIFLGISCAALILFFYAAIPFVIVFYMALSLFFKRSFIHNQQSNL